MFNGVKFKSITLKNFLSTGNVAQVMNLNDAGLTLILGENLDMGGNNSRNGVGKTAAINAISYGLFGKPLTNIKIPNLINKTNGKHMVVTIEFEKDNHTYRITRGKKPDIFSFVVDGKVIDDNETNLAQGETRDTQKDIEGIIGLSHLMFKHIIALTTYTEPFLKMPVAKQREVIEELLGITLLSTKAEILKEKIKEIKIDIDKEKYKIDTIVDSNNSLQKTIDQTAMRSKLWEKQHTERITQINSDLNHLKEFDFESELEKYKAIEVWDKKSFELKSQIKSISSEYDLIRREIEYLLSQIKTLENKNLDPSDTLSHIEGMIGRYNTEISSIDNKISEFHQSKEKLEKDLSDPDHLNCRTCGQELKDTDHLTYVVRRMNEDLNKIKNDIDKAEKDKSDYNEKIKEFETEIENTKISYAEMKKSTEDELKILNEQFNKKSEKFEEIHN
ncbi:MAG: hypothetical protein WC284_16325, partial [Candidimonas sp.]